MRTAWEGRGKDEGRTREGGGKGMGRGWEGHGKGMGRGWEGDGKGMGRAWEGDANGMLTSRQRHAMPSSPGFVQYLPARSPLPLHAPNHRQLPRRDAALLQGDLLLITTDYY